LKSSIALKATCARKFPSTSSGLWKSDLIEDFGIADVFQLIGQQRKTGILELTTPAATFSLELEAGDIVHAHSNHTPQGQRLGDILVAQNAIERDVLEEICKSLGGTRLGEALLERNLVTSEALLSALEFQIQLLFNRMFEAATLGFTTLHRGAMGDARSSAQNNQVAEFLGDYNYATASNTKVYATWNDTRAGDVCGAVQQFRAAIRGLPTSMTSGVDWGEDNAASADAQVAAAPRPLPSRDCPSGSRFGNSDVFSVTATR